MFYRYYALAASLLFISICQLPALAQTSGRQGQTQPTPQTTQPTTTTPAPVVQPGGRGRGGGVPGPGPAIGGDIDETPVVTHHSANVQGKVLNYTATVAQMPLKNAS